MGKPPNRTGIGTPIQGAASNSLAQSTGATLSPTYHDTQIGVIGVNVEDLRDLNASSKEEFGQFSIGQFFWSGSFWLGLEKLISNGFKDPLFLVCAAIFICGGAVSYSGFRQLKRRKTRIENIINNAQKKDA